MGGAIDSTTGELLGLEQIHRMSLGEVMELFARLPAPASAEMNGEYRARLTDQGSLAKNLSAQLAIANPLLPGKWLCKAFTPGQGERSHGYNSFSRLGRIVRRFCMATSIVPSRFDGQPVFQLDYVPMGSILGRMHMVDELRRVRIGLYLGVGTWGRSEPERMVPHPFTLAGPERAFVGADPGLK